MPGDAFTHSEASKATAVPISDANTTGILAKATPASAKRKPMPRKGHTKSRRGCFSCKSRKVKCTEDLPQCLPCRRNGLSCEYPNIRYRRLAQPKDGPHALETERGALMIAAATPGPQAPLTSFSPDDMRFFSHFIFVAYPNLPLNGSKIWMDAAQMSHEYECLMHSMLALAASHLTLCTSSNYSSQALSHRVRAIRSLNTMLSKPGATFSAADGDAAFAALLSLVYQSAYLPECMLEFVAMVRGCQIISSQIIPDIGKSAFRLFLPEVHNAIFFETTKSSSPHCGTGLSSLHSGLRALAPMCKSVVELGLLADVQKTLQLYMDDPVQAYAHLPVVFGHFGRMNNEDFTLFCDPSNHTTRILLAHFFLIDYFIDKAINVDTRPSLQVRKHVTLAWIEKVAAESPHNYAPFIRQALDVAREAIHGSPPLITNSSPEETPHSSTRSSCVIDLEASGSADRSPAWLTKQG